MLMRKTILLGFLLMAVVISVGAQTPTEKVSTGRLTGSVYDKNLSYIPSTIVAECNGRKFEAEIGANAYYSLDLPPGICRMSALPRDGYGQWFYKATRASIEIKPDEEQKLNFYPTIRIVSVALVVTKNGLRSPATMNPPQADIAFSISQKSRVDALLQFAERSIEGTFSTYTKCILTFGNTTVIADTMLVDLNFSTFKLTGHLILDANGKITKGTKGTVKNIDGNLVASVR